MIEGMKTPLFIRPLTENERSQIQAGLRSKDAFVLRRSQVLLASDRGERATAIAKQLGCHRQTVLNIIHGFNAAGLAVLEEGSSRPHRLRTTFPDETLEALRDLLHRSPSDFGLDTSVWTLSLAAQISFQQGLTPRLVSGESVRRALQRLGKSWKRAKQWITSPDPHYLLKKPSGQTSRWSSLLKASFKGSQISLTLVPKAKALQLAASGGSTCLALLSPRHSIEMSRLLQKLL